MRAEPVGRAMWGTWSAVRYAFSTGETIGPVVLGDEGTSLRMYFLMSVGTASAWQVPGTVPLGARSHLGLMQGWGDRSGVVTRP